jgi:hypothetical protein
MTWELFHFSLLRFLNNSSQTFLVIGKGVVVALFALISNAPNMYLKELFSHFFSLSPSPHKVLVIMLWCISAVCQDGFWAQATTLTMLSHLDFFYLVHSSQ